MSEAHPSRQTPPRHKGREGAHVHGFRARGCCWDCKRDLKAVSYFSRQLPEFCVEFRKPREPDIHEDGHYIPSFSILGKVLDHVLSVGF